MKLSQLKKGDRAIIKEIDLPSDIKQRLNSMGLTKSAEIYLCRVGLFGGSFYIKIEYESCVIISKNEADKVEVEPIKGGFRHRWGRKFSDGCESCCQGDIKEK